MKKFQFSLDNVLKYKNQVLDNLMNEHAGILIKIRKQEELILSLQQQYVDCGQELSQQQQRGITVMKIYSYQNYMEVLAYKVKKEQETLGILKRQEEIKRQQVVDAKKESASIEKLKEKKIAGYQKELQKEEELLIEEFVSHNRSVHAAG